MEMADWNAGCRWVRQLLEQLFSLGEPEQQEETESESEKKRQRPRPSLLTSYWPFIWFAFCCLPFAITFAFIYSLSADQHSLVSFLGFGHLCKGGSLFWGRRTMRGLHINSGKQMSTSVAIDFSFAKGYTHHAHTTPTCTHAHTDCRKIEEHTVRKCIMIYSSIPVSSDNNRQPTFFPVCTHARLFVCVNVADLATYCTIFFC